MDIIYHTIPYHTIPYHTMGFKTRKKNQRSRRETCDSSVSSGQVHVVRAASVSHALGNLFHVSRGSAPTDAAVRQKMGQVCVGWGGVGGFVVSWQPVVAYSQQLGLDSTRTLHVPVYALFSVEQPGSHQPSSPRNRPP